VCTPTPFEKELEPGSVCYVAGWGLIKEGFSQLNRELKEAAISKIATNMCNMGWGLNKRVDDQTMICAGDLKGNFSRNFGENQNVDKK